MKLKNKVLASLVLGGLSVSPVWAAEDTGYIGTPSAEALAYTCAGCHGPNGSSHGPATPSLAGASKVYFIDAMANYKEADGRASTIMSRIAKGYTEEEINLMAGYFAAQKMVVYPQDFDPKLAKAGAKIHKKYCEKCHEDGGRSAEDDAGILAGQRMPYLTYTMDDFRAGHREMTKKMKKKVNQLEKKEGDSAFVELINFYGSEK